MAAGHMVASGGMCCCVFHPDVSKPYRRMAADAAIRHHSALVTGESTLPGIFVAIPPAASLITSVFMHGGWLHLGGNMLYLDFRR